MKRGEVDKMYWSCARAKRSIGATILSVAMVLTIFMPAVIFSSQKYPESTAIDKTEDIFEGKFSPPDIAAVPDETFDVSFSISPTMDVPNTIIRFIMPAHLVKLVEGDQVWMGDVENGKAVTLTLSFATSGEVEAYVRANVEASAPGKKYRSSYYLHVATPKAEFARTIKGGSTTPDSPEIAISAALNPEAPCEAVNPESPGTIRIKGRFTYVNEDGGFSPARHMLVWIRDDDLGEDEWVAYQWTNANGEFDITCDNDDGFLQDGRDPYAQLWAEGEWDWITTTSGGDTYFWNNPKCGDDVPDGFFYDYGSRHPTSDNDALQAGDAVYAESQWIWDRVTWQRPTKVTIRWPRETWPHCHGDTIDLPDKLTAGWEHDTVQHEYGHSVLWTLYGNSWPVGCVGGTHWISMEFTLPDAWNEGWAQFMRCAVDNDVHNLDREGHDIEDNDWYNHQDTGDMDGDIIEGSVASILWDIHDPINIAERDYMGWGFDEIFYVLQTQNPNSIHDFWFDMIILWNDMNTCIGPLSTIFWNYGIDRDYYAPHDGFISINAGASATSSTSVTLTLSCEDWGSGVTSMRFSSDLGATWSIWFIYETTVPWTLDPGEGWKRLDVQFRDGADYSTEALTIYDGIYLDTSPPTGSIIINSGNPAYTGSTAVTLYLTYSDSLSGVAAVYYGNAGESWVGPFSPTATKAWTLSPGDDGQTRTVYYLIYDYAGNYYMCSDSIILDTTSPTGSIIINSGNPAYTGSTAVTLYLTYSDSLSGVAAVYYGNAGESWVGPFSPTATKAWTLSPGDGTKTVWYLIYDLAGNSYMCSDSITLDATPPVANANGPYTGAEGYSVTFDGSGSYDLVGIVSYSWSFGDGYAGTGVYPSHTYAHDGIYTVTLTVTDNLGATDVDTTTATINDRNPIPRFSAYPLVADPPSTVDFTDQSVSYDGIVSWLWHFGDGQTSTQQNPTHEYTDEGDYTVSLTVEEADGDSATTTKINYIQVWEAINVVFDESHVPMYTFNENNGLIYPGGYAEFAYYLMSAGYAVSTIDFGTTINSAVLAPVDVLVIAAPQMSYSTSEIDAIETWVKDGGKLLLITEADYGGYEASFIAERFGFTQPLDLILDSDENVDGYPYWVYYDSANLLAHPVTAGVTRVEMYESDGIASAPLDETPLILTDSDYSAWYYSGDPALGVSLMSAIDGGSAGSGRMIFITDSDMWGAQPPWGGYHDFDGDGDENFYDSDNEVLALNAIYWLASADVLVHDVRVTDVTPSKTVVGQGYSMLIDVTVENQGESFETFNVTLYYGDSAITTEQWETFWSLGDVNRDGYINDVDGDLLQAAFMSRQGSVNWNPWADLNQDSIVDTLDYSMYGLHYGYEIWTYFINGGVIQTLLVIDLGTNTQQLTFTWDTSGILYGDYVVCAYAVPILPKEVDRADNTFVDGTVTVTIAGDIDGDGDVDYDDFLAFAAAYLKTSEQPGYSPECDFDGDGDVDYFDFLIFASNYLKIIP